MYENLKKIGKDEIWLKKQVEKFNIKPENALIVTFDGKEQIFCQEKKKGNENERCDNNYFNYINYYSWRFNDAKLLKQNNRRTTNRFK